MYLHYSTILVEMEDTLCILSMNRPKLRNAINEAMLDDLNDFLEKAKDDPRIRALVITGAGKGFSPVLMLETGMTFMKAVKNRCGCPKDRR